MESVTLKVGGMTCMGCVNSVKKALQPIPGVGSVDVSLGKGEATIDYDPTTTSLPQLRAAIEGAGFEVA